MDTSSAVSNTDNTGKSDESEGALVETLHRTFSRMFSKENLEIDPYLRPHLSPSMSLPLDIVVESPLVQTITKDAAVIERALRTSNSVVVGENSIRPNIKVEQHTIILRDVDSDVTESAIREMLVAANCGNVVGCRSEMNSTWFVTFASEDAARDSLINIRSSTLGGKPVRARLKTESITKSFYQPRGRGDPNMAPTVGESSPGSPNRPSPVPTDPYPGQGQHSVGPSPPGPMPGPIPPNGMPPAPMYYVYPPYPGMPMPMPPGSPMYFMGGMWPPMMPMMQMPHQQTMNGNNGGRGGRGQGRGHNKSPRSGGGKTQHTPPSPTGPHGQRPRGNSHGSKGQGQPMQIQASPYGYGHPFPMPSPDGREQHRGPVSISYDAMGNPIMHMAGTPVHSPRMHTSDASGESTREKWQDADEGKGDKNRKKTAKTNKKKEKSSSQEAGAVPAAGVESVAIVADKKGKGDGPVKSANASRGPEGAKEKTTGKERTDKSPRARAPGQGGKSHKPQPEFNMESDFPTLGVRGVGGSQATAASGTSWAAAIMKAPGEPISIPVHSSERPSDDKISVQIENATTGSHSDSNGIAESDDVGVSFGNATAWMTGQNDVSVPVSVDTRAKSHGDTELGYNSASSIIVDEPVDCAISFGAFDQPAVSADSAAPQESKPKPSKDATEERPPAAGSPSKTGEKQKRSKGNNSRSGSGNKKTENVDVATEDESAAASEESGGKVWGAKSFLDVVRGGKN